MLVDVVWSGKPFTRMNQNVKSPKTVDLTLLTHKLQAEIYIPNFIVVVHWCLSRIRTRIQTPLLPKGNSFAKLSQSTLL